MEQSDYEDLVAAYRTLAEHGVIDAYGHVSLRSPSNPKRYFIARSLAPVNDRPERLGAVLAQELERWNRVVTSAKITGD